MYFIIFFLSLLNFAYTSSDDVSDFFGEASINVNALAILRQAQTTSLGAGIGIKWSIPIKTKDDIAWNALLGLESDAYYKSIDDNKSSNIAIRPAYSMHLHVGQIFDFFENGFFFVHAFSLGISNNAINMSQKKIKYKIKGDAKKSENKTKIIRTYKKSVEGKTLSRTLSINLSNFLSYGDNVAYDSDFIKNSELNKFISDDIDSMHYNQLLLGMHFGFNISFLDTEYFKCGGGIQYSGIISLHNIIIPQDIYPASSLPISYVNDKLIIQALKFDPYAIPKSKEFDKSVHQSFDIAGIVPIKVDHSNDVQKDILCSASTCLRNVDIADIPLKAKYKDINKDDKNDYIDAIYKNISQVIDQEYYNYYVIKISAFFSIYL